MSFAKPTHLTRAQIDTFESEVNAIRASVMNRLGQADVDHIRKMIRICRISEVGGRALLHFGVGPLSWVAGVMALAHAKILDNMEIGHNVMHGQYDWTGDPALNSQKFEWDIACDGEQWRHSHNVMHTHQYFGQRPRPGLFTSSHDRRTKMETTPLVSTARQLDAGHGLSVRGGVARPGDWQIHARGDLQT